MHYKLMKEHLEAMNDDLLTLFEHYIMDHPETPPERIHMVHDFVDYVVKFNKDAITTPRKDEMTYEKCAVDSNEIMSELERLRSESKRNV